MGRAASGGRMEVMAAARVAAGSEVVAEEATAGAV